MYLYNIIEVKDLSLTMSTKFLVTSRPQTILYLNIDSGIMILQFATKDLECTCEVGNKRFEIYTLHECETLFVCLIARQHGKFWKGNKCFFGIRM